MSQIGKKPVKIPEGVEVKIEGQVVTVSGPKGELTRTVRPEVKVEIDEDIKVSLKKEERRFMAYWGTERALIQNMVEGVSKGFERKLRLEGVGYRASMEDGKLDLKLGFSHDVVIEVPEGIELDVKKKVVTIMGTDKAQVNQLAAQIRKIRKPNIYTGKGVRYDGEEIKLRPGKKAIGSE